MIERHRKSIRTVGRLFVIVAVVVRFAYWQVHPSIVLAAVFWALAMIPNLERYLRRRFYFLNNGYQPKQNDTPIRVVTYLMPWIQA